MKTIAKTLLVILLAFQGSAQYSTAIGLRAGETSGLTIKQFIGGSNALEGILGVWQHGGSATLLFEHHAPAFGNGFNWYYGAGGHVSFQTTYSYWYRYERRNYYYYRDGGTGLGIDGVLGLEYKIPKAPNAISFDLKPYIEFYRGYTWLALDPGLGIKVAF